MPQLEASAMPADELFAVALIPSVQTGKKALRELLAEGQIQSQGKGVTGDPCRYWLARKPKPAISGKLKNQVLLQTLRGEEPGEE